MAQSAQPHRIAHEPDQATELAQRAWMTLDVARADLEVAEALLGATDPTVLHFRQALDEAQHAWDRLRARFGGRMLEAALDGPPVAVLQFSVRSHRAKQPNVTLILIGGKTYRIEAIAGTPLAPTQYRLTRLRPPLEHGPYYACRLADGSTQCDCAEWYYRDDAPTAPDLCKHLAALDGLGWL